MKVIIDAPRIILMLLVVLTGSGVFAAAKGDITESEYDKKLRNEQESAFSPWMPAKDAFEQFRQGKLGGKLLLAAERDSNGQIRLMHFIPPDGKGGDVIYENDVPEETLLERHAIWQKQDYNILFARKNPSGNYTALWIYSPRFDVAMKRLSEVGISTPSVRIKSGPVADATAATPSVTAPLQSWRDKSGRVLQAAVAGIQGGTVNFVRSDGKKFSFPMADLSEADQKRLADLRSKSAEVSDASTSAKGGRMTEWMSRNDFDTEVAKQRGLGMFGLYVETSSRNEFRGIFDKRPETVRWFQLWAEPEQSLREKHASYVAQGLALLTLSHERRTDRYCAVWISGIPAGDAKALLGKFGISTASIGDKITVSTLPKR